MTKQPRALVVAMVLVAAPIALALETTLRLLLFPEDFELIREYLEPTLTPVAWGLAAGSALAALVGLAAQRWLLARRAAKRASEASEADASEAERTREAVTIFLVTSSIPQMPSLFATFCFTFGAALLPVLVGIALCTVGIVAQARRL